MYHVWSSSWAVHCEESETGAVQSVQVVECVCQQLTEEIERREMRMNEMVLCRKKSRCDFEKESA